MHRSDGAPRKRRSEPFLQTHLDLIEDPNLEELADFIAEDISVDDWVAILVAHSSVQMLWRHLRKRDCRDGMLPAEASAKTVSRICKYKGEAQGFYQALVKHQWVLRSADGMLEAAGYLKWYGPMFERLEKKAEAERARTDRLAAEAAKVKAAKERRAKQARDRRAKNAPAETPKMRRGFAAEKAATERLRNGYVAVTSPNTEAQNANVMQQNAQDSLSTTCGPKNKIQIKKEEPKTTTPPAAERRRIPAPLEDRELTAIEEELSGSLAGLGLGLGLGGSPSAPKAPEENKILTLYPIAWFETLVTTHGLAVQLDSESIRRFQRMRPTQQEALEALAVTLAAGTRINRKVLHLLGVVEKAREAGKVEAEHPRHSDAPKPKRQYTDAQRAYSESLWRIAVANELLQVGECSIPMGARIMELGISEEEILAALRGRYGSDWAGVYNELSKRKPVRSVPRKNAEPVGSHSVGE